MNKKNNYNEVFLTEGMDGKIVEHIYSANTVDDAFYAIENWKDTNRSKYKVEEYNRVIYKNKDNKIVVDFGDYQHFMLIKLA